MTRYPAAVESNFGEIVDHAKRASYRGMGPTTIRAGEPGVIFRSADGKSTQGGIGTGPDGKVSVMVDVFGAVQDIRNPINANRSSITDLDVSKATKAALDIESGRITYLDQTKASQAALNIESGRITYLDQNKASNTALGVERGRIDGLDRTKANQSALNVEAGRISNVDQKADNAYARGTQGVNAAAAAQADANAAQAQAASTAAAIGALVGRINSLQDQIDKMKANGGAG